jgi:biofilm protein TabA
MILDLLDNADRYRPLHPLLAAGFEFLRAARLESLPPGKHEVQGEQLFATISHGPGKSREAAQLEFHHKYIDIQYVAAGTDTIGWSPTTECRQISKPYDAGSDVGFFRDPAQTWLTVPARHFAIFFPTDAHAPLATTEIVHKVVVKVAVEEMGE